jgi:hypothetical protein
MKSFSFYRNFKLTYKSFKIKKEGIKNLELK